ALDSGGRLTIEQDGRVLREGLRQRYSGSGRDRRLRRPVRAGPEPDPPLLEGRRPKHRLAFAGDDLRPGNVLVPRVVAAHRLDVRVRLAVRTCALDLRAVSRRLVVCAYPVF